MKATRYRKLHSSQGQDNSLVQEPAQSKGRVLIYVRANTNYNQRVSTQGGGVQKTPSGLAWVQLAGQTVITHETVSPPKVFHFVTTGKWGITILLIALKSWTNHHPHLSGFWNGKISMLNGLV